MSLLIGTRLSHFRGGELPFGDHNRSQAVKMRSLLSSASLPSLPLGRTGRTGAPWTLTVPFAVVAVLIEGSVALPPGPVRWWPFLIGSLLLILMVGTLGLPWHRSSPWVAVLPSLTFVLGAALLVYSAGGTDTGLLPVFLAPILLTALYQERWHSAVVVGAVLVVIVVISLGEHNALELLLRRVGFYGVMGTMIAIGTLGLRARLGQAVAAREELLRQANALSQAAERLNSLLSSEAVLSEACRLAAVMASEPGIAARRAAYLRLEGDAVHCDWEYDEAVGPVSSTYPPAENPHLARLLRTGRPETGAYVESGMSPTFVAALLKAGITHGAWIPVAPHGVMHGVLSVSSRGRPVSDDIFQRAISMGHIIELALANALTVESSERDASTDPLTGLANRRGFDQWSDRLRGRQPFAVLVLDVDGLKMVNDQRGHATGDALLRGVGRVSAGVMREGDLFARVGGDEFAAFLGGCSEEGARSTADRILEALEVTTIEGVVPHVSIGIACGSQGCDPAQVLGQADTAMYAAKRLGGNSFVLGEPTLVSAAARHGGALPV
jgi:diguanylate cyclase (GGDEF)-like protein